jgi:CRP/FNR family cyclic AMP-dependent transcriptional regulator
MRKALYILGQLNDADIQWLADHGRTRHLRDGEIVIQEGRPIDAIFLNLEGALAVTAGDGVEVARLGAGEFVGEISFVDSAPPSATVKGVGQSSVLEIKRTAMSPSPPASIAHSRCFSPIACAPPIGAWATASKAISARSKCWRASWT